MKPRHLNPRFITMVERETRFGGLDAVPLEDLAGILTAAIECGVVSPPVEALVTPLGAYAKDKWGNPILKPRGDKVPGYTDKDWVHYKK